LGILPFKLIGRRGSVGVFTVVDFNEDEFDFGGLPLSPSAPEPRKAPDHENLSDGDTCPNYPEIGEYSSRS
jgi:hypothetical protein